MLQWLADFFASLWQFVQDALWWLWSIPADIVSGLFSSLSHIGPWAPVFAEISSYGAAGYLAFVDYVFPVQYAFQCAVNYFALALGVKAFVGAIRYIKGWV